MARKSVYATQADIERIRARMVNLAERTNRAALRVMRKEANTVMGLAMRFAPHDKGLLDAKESWQLKESRTGINGRLEFTIALNNRRWLLRGGKRITLAQYSEFMHNGWSVFRPYSLGKGSIAKARASGLGITPTGSGYYVGWRYLTRALRVRQLRTIQQVRSAVGDLYQ